VNDRPLPAGPALLGILLGLIASAASAQEVDPTRLPVEQLMDAEVEPSSKALLGSPMALYVIRREDIRRSGATSIPEALRMAPGVEVARIDSNKWSIAIRGFAGRFGNKLLVLIDGHSVVSPLFDGVFWDAQDVLLEDIERIEVIRGPGAATWAANAVDGVINILTRHPRETRGVLLEGGGGSEERAFAGIRVGARIGEGLYLRGYEKYVSRASFASEGFTNAGDAWDVLRGGLRLDWDAGRDLVTIEGDAYRGDAGGLVDLPTLVPPYHEIQAEDIELSGGNARGHWKRRFAGGSELVAEGGFDRTRRVDAVYDEKRSTFDLGLRHRFSPAERLVVAWGLDFSSTSDDLSQSRRASFDPTRRSDHVLGGFGQGDLGLAANRLHVVLGSRLERNDYTGFEMQPSLRLVFDSGRRWSTWAGLSRAFRRPSRSEHDVEIGLPPAPTLSGLLEFPLFEGSRGFVSETVLAYEAGARLERGRLLLDIALFHGDYQRLRTVEPRPAAITSEPPQPLVVPISPENRGEGTNSGVELAAWWRVSSRLRLAASGNWLRLKLRAPPGSLDSSLATTAADSPSYQAHLRSSLDLPGPTLLDVALYQVGSRRGVPAHLRLDARVALKPWKPVELSAGFQDLLQARHAELSPSFLTSPALVERGAYVKLTVTY
jgi:iron complex outermembrane receptor protein